MSLRTVPRAALVALAVLAAVLALAAPPARASVVWPDRRDGLRLVQPRDVCNRYCDRRDPALAAGDRSAATASIFGRALELHADDPDDMAWASIDNGDPTDEVWLDRSFNGGQSWADGSKLGDTTVPDGHRGWRTMMYNVDNPPTGVGAVRACGKAGNRVEIACTPWVRTTVGAGNRVDAATTALMQFYDDGSGLWTTTNWWNAANDLTALLDYQLRTGSADYRYAIANTFDRNKNAQGGNFTNKYLDDTGWWGLAWVRAYDLTGDARYLAMARTDADYIGSYRDNTCGGGVWWSTDRTYKNAIANELYLKLTASLHNRIGGDTGYLAAARQEWDWFAKSGMINSSHLVNDGLDSNCRNNGQTTWTYNQGVLLGGLVELHRATGDAGLVTAARRVADAATGSAALNPGGILTEPCESGDCGNDGPSFKGVFARNLGELDRALADHPYHAYLGRQADSAHAHDRDAMDRYGLHWAGPFDKADAARQHSALDVLTAAM